MRPTKWERSSPNFCAYLISAVCFRPLWYGRRQAASSFPAIPTAADQALLRWPRRPPDLTPCDFLLWGYVGDCVVLPPVPQDLPEQWRRIIAAISDIDRDMLQQVRAEMDYRLDACRVTTGGQVQHLLGRQKSVWDLEVCHLPYVYTTINLILFYTYSQSQHNCIVKSDKPLHWVQQLHVSALVIGHHQVVLRLIEQLNNKQGILRWLGVVGGRDLVPPTTPQSPSYTLQPDDDIYSSSKHVVVVPNVVVYHSLTISLLFCDWLYV